MPRFHIVTDSAATFADLHWLQLYPVTIVPNRIAVDGQHHLHDSLLEASADHDAINRALADVNRVPRLLAPTIADFAAVFVALSDQADGVIVLVTSRDISQSWQNARVAAQQMNGKCAFEVIDSRTICAGLGMLVHLAARATQTAADFEQLLQVVRAAVERVYAAYYVETLHRLRYNGIMDSAHSALCTMLGIKPFLSIEEGRLLVTEKVRTQAQAIERLVEFLVEFEALDDALIVHQTDPTDVYLHDLQQRLQAEFQGRRFALVRYAAPMATLIGNDAVGLVVLESELEHFHDDF
jgi:DegV family protein with EDD domain